MQAEEIGLLLKQERGQFLEFISAYEYRRAAGQKKREEDLAREIVRALSGMANADGGTVLVGVEPDKSVTGIPCQGEELQSLIQSLQTTLAPPLHPSCQKLNLGNLLLLKCEVSPSLEVHRVAGGRTFYRIATENASLPAEQVQSLKESKKHFFYERQHVLDAVWEDLDGAAVEAFTERIKEPRDPKSVLGHPYHLLDYSREKPSLTMAAVLLFARDPFR